jgi:hypothetical protein
MIKKEILATLVAFSALQGKSTETEWKLREVNLIEADLSGDDISGPDPRTVP